jgi:hypothetical protein
MSYKYDWCSGQPSGQQVMATGDRSIVVSVQSYFKNPGAYTASFTLQLVDPGTAFSAALRCEATVEWTVGGNTVTRRINVINGTSIQGLAESARIVIRDVSFPQGAGLGLGQRYSVSVQIAPGGRGSFETPPLLNEALARATIFALNTFTLPIPENIGVKSCLVMIGSATAVPIPEQSVQVFLRDQAANELCRFDPRAFAWFPILPGATVLKIDNSNPVITVFASVSFGIDG